MCEKITTKAVSRVNCCVYGCSTRRDRDKKFSFHAFPRENERRVEIQSRPGLILNMDRRKAWIYVLRQKKKIGRYLRVCSRHFKKEDFFKSEGK